MKQLHILSATGDEDSKAVSQVFASMASRFGMAENTVTSRVPDTICSYVERIGYGFGIGARVVGGTIVIDFNRGNRPSPDFPAVVDFIDQELRRIFGGRVYVPTESEYIEIQNTLPISEAARDFNKRHSAI